ncbi:MAG: hypothetical protein WD492_01745 [Alkalispirochaeta sp.]
MRRLNIKSITITILLMGVGLASATAQSNEFVDEVLAQDRITYGNAAYLLLVGSGDLDESASLSYARDRFESGPAALGRGVNESVTLGEYSLLAMNAFGITGGMMYTLVPSPRYAARELAFRQVIQGRAYPRMDLSGQRAMRLIGRVLTLDEQGRLR